MCIISDLIPVCLLSLASMKRKVDFFSQFDEKTLNEAKEKAFMDVAAYVAKRDGTDTVTVLRNYCLLNKLKNAMGVTINFEGPGNLYKPKKREGGSFWTCLD